jgi:hypothetical protein
MIIQDNQKLVRNDGTPASVGDIYITNRLESYELTGGRPPQHAGSTGRVYVREEKDAMTREFFPSVIGLRWEKF